MKQRIQSMLLPCLAALLTSLGPARSGAAAAAAVSALPSPLICEDTIDGLAPFNQNDVPCVLGCGTPLAVATGGLLPGSVNETDIPYCQARCVRGQGPASQDLSPAQSAAAPSCASTCKYQYAVGGSPENFAWCMYWCVDGVDIGATTTCVPWQAYGPVETTVLGDVTETYRELTEPSAWIAWYETQTIESRLANMVPATVSLPSSPGSSQVTLTSSPGRDTTPSPTTPVPTAGQDDQTAGKGSPSSSSETVAVAAGDEALSTTSSSALTVSTSSESRSGAAAGNSEGIGGNWIGLVAALLAAF